MSNQNAPPLTPISDPFGRFYCEEEKCYRFATTQEMPEFRIDRMSVIYAAPLQPQPGDIVVCHPLTPKGGYVIGRFKRNVGSRVVLELATGVVCVVLSSAIVVITSIV
jgi:hypothetical protein